MDAKPMGPRTKIEWTEATWSPVVGCTKSARDVLTATPNGSCCVKDGHASVLEWREQTLCLTVFCNLFTGVDRG